MGPNLRTYLGKAWEGYILIYIYILYTSISNGNQNFSVSFLLLAAWIVIFSGLLNKPDKPLRTMPAVAQNDQAPKDSKDV